MREHYRFGPIEAKWQKAWEDLRAFQAREDDPRPKFYCLEMYPYPSGRVHMGHVRNYSIGDVITRFKMMRGFNVLHPIGWDALGLPAENAAIKHGIHPRDWTLNNIAHMREQLKRLGFGYDWSREVNTCLPEYYRWNQWLFLKMFERGLAYRRKSWVNWCPQCRTVLANEQAQGGECWRCETPVVQKQTEHWFLKITDYAEELLSGHGRLQEWPEHVLLMQKNWIGKSTGTRLVFPVPEWKTEIEVFTTRVDTIYGATFLVLSPEHPLVERLLSDPNVSPPLREWAGRAVHEAHTRRDPAEIVKEGMDTGLKAVNPFSGEEIPVWLANYVLMGYGTGAIMAVPAHDQRDHDFAVKYGLPIRTVIEPEEGGEDRPEGLAFEGQGRMVNSGPYSGRISREAVAEMNRYAESKNFGRESTIYRLRDWGISRQRYWGTPIPIVHCPKCGIVGVPYDQLPVELPRDANLTGTEGSPLERVESFARTTCPKCGGPARRDTDTMDTFFDSSWYYFRYTSPKEDSLPVDRRAAEHWMPVDLYIGGVEHAILHLIYARFFTKVFRDLGLAGNDEPFPRYLAQGMVTKDGSAMSKSRGNVVDPDDTIARHGADALRLFILFASPPDKEFAWNEDGIEGCSRFLHRLWNTVRDCRRIFDEAAPSGADLQTGDGVSGLRRRTHRTIKRVTEDIETRVHLNTAVSSIMELVNHIRRAGEEAAATDAGREALREALESALLLLAPFAPHICEELWEATGHATPLVRTPWPDYDPGWASEEKAVIVVQVNGKLKDRFEIASGTPEDVLREQALSRPKVRAAIGRARVRKTVCIPDKLVNIVVG
ncbi:MAG: leucine--tRNA ligase [Candidatus Aminicenantes bacterium]|nr:leucine--tRNA ligase [Candidatus Aminicenantes bacterium]